MAGCLDTHRTFRVFAEDDEHVRRSEFKRLRRQVKETRAAMRDMMASHRQELYDLMALARMSQRVNGVARDQIGDVRLEVAGELKSQHLRLEELEGGVKSLDAWADGIAIKADPDALWEELAERDAKIEEL